MLDVVVFEDPDMLPEFGGVSVFSVAESRGRNDVVWFLYLVLKSFSVSPMYVSVV